MDGPQRHPLAADGDGPSAPSATELAVTAIWSELLDRRDIGPDEDFFALGGDSLLAVWLIEEIAARTGHDLPLSALLDGATVRQLARAIDAHAARSSGQRGINVHGSRRPLFWIHGWAELLAMRAHFDPEQPVFQIQEPLTRRWQVKPPLEVSARRYVEEVRRIQADGPYRLIGYSFGGVIAYEMARQLHAGGEPVSLLALLDSPAPGYVFPRSVRLRMHAANAAQVGRMLAELRTRSWQTKGSYVRHTFPAITRHRWLRWLVRRLPPAWPVPTPPGSVVRIQYEPRPYDGEVVLFWATEGWGHAGRTPELGWGPLARGGISVRPVPGGHRTMAYGQNAAGLAREITASLSDR